MIVKVTNQGITLDLSNVQEVCSYLQLMGYGTAIPLPDGTYQVDTQDMCFQPFNESSKQQKKGSYYADQKSD